MNRDRMCSPQSGAVRSLFAVSGGPPCTMPSPVPTLCRRKSPNGVKDLIPDCLRHFVSAAIDHGSGPSGGEGLHMAGNASDRDEKIVAGKRIRRCSQRVVAWRRLRPTNELGKMIY